MEIKIENNRPEDYKIVYFKKRVDKEDKLFRGFITPDDIIYITFIDEDDTIFIKQADKVKVWVDNDPNELKDEFETNTHKSMEFRMLNKKINMLKEKA